MFTGNTERNNIWERFEWNDEDTDFATARIFKNKISMVIFRRRFFVLKLNPIYSIEVLNLARWKRLIESNFVPILKRNERVPWITFVTRCLKIAVEF